MAMAVSSGDGTSFSHINMTPLIDVMLVLLIIFIITIPGETHAVKIDNPSQVPSAHPEPMDLSIDFDGGLRWNGHAVDRTTMQGYMSQEAAKIPPPEVHIRIDKFSKLRSRRADLGGFAAPQVK